VAIPDDLPVIDHHCHLSPSGEGLRAAERFARAGGSHLFLTTMNWKGTPPLRVDDYAEQFEGMDRLAKRIRSDTGLVVHLVLAPYPVDLLAQAEAAGLRSALDLQRSAIDRAGRWIRERRAVALGEIGRPHFPIARDRREAADEVFDYALASARDLDCPAIVHCEDLDAAGFSALAERARRAGLRPERVVKHYARAVMSPEETHGVAPSYLARRESVRAALPRPGPWFLETDYLDDPARPGAVMDLTTIPRRTREIAATDASLLPRLRIPFVEAIRATYGFVPVRGGPS
jgi:TatD-related deoxyribonuclease